MQFTSDYEFVNFSVKLHMGFAVVLRPNLFVDFGRYINCLFVCLRYLTGSLTIPYSFSYLFTLLLQLLVYCLLL